jgi:hypothetical protein
MPEFDSSGLSDFHMPANVVPALSYGRVRDVTDAVTRYLDNLSDKIRRHINASLVDAGNVGARAEVKILERLAGKLTPPEELLHGMVADVQNSLAGNLAPAVALLEELGQPYGALPEMGKGLGQLPVFPSGSPQPAGGTGRMIRTGDAARGRSAGALTAEENELGVDPAVIDSSQVVLQAPSGAVDFSKPPPGVVSTGVVPGGQAPAQGMSQRALDYLAQCRQQNPNCCDPPWVVWAPPVPGAEACVVSASNCLIPGGWIPCGNPFPSLDDALTFADQCTAAGTCPGAAPQPQPQPTPAPVQQPPPIGSPPPPPPECCPPPVINVPPCPPPPSLPDCVKIEFCDWDKLCSTLRDCLPGAKPTEDCALDNTDAWVYKDCEGTFGSQLSQWLGGDIGAAAESDTLQGMVDAALQIAGVADASSFMPLVPLELPPTTEPG